MIIFNYFSRVQSASQKHSLHCFLEYALECSHSKAYSLSNVNYVSCRQQKKVLCFTIRSIVKHIPRTLAVNNKNIF